METLSFTTSARRRDPQVISVELCGESLAVSRPKDSVLYFASVAIGSDVADVDRAMAILQFVDSTLAAGDRKRFFDRAIDRTDPMDLKATLDLMSGLLDRWNDWPTTGDVDELIIEGAPISTGEPVHLLHEDLDLDVVAHPPKDLVLLCVAASMATGANVGQQAWAVGLFLDAALDPGDALLISRRMRQRDDELDLVHVIEIVESLLSKWAPRRNRAERRAAERGRA